MPISTAAPVHAFEVLVSGAQGGPFAGAEAVLTGVENKRRVHVASGVTDATGAVSLSHARQKYLELRVTALGHAGAEPDVDGKTESVDVSLTPLGRIEGLVVDNESQPVPANMTLALSPAALAVAVHMHSKEMPASTLSTACDVDGRFEFRALPPAARYRLRATADGLVPSEVSVDVPSGGVAKLTVKLRRSGSLVGRCLGHLDQPLRDAEVRLYVKRSRGYVQSAGKRTGDDGRFRFEAVAPGRVILEVGHETHDTMTHISRAITIQEGGNDAGDLRPAARTLRVSSVLEAKEPETRKPFAGLSVFVASEEPTAFASLRARVRFGSIRTFRGLPAGRYELSLMPEDRALEVGRLEFEIRDGPVDRDVEVVARERAPTVDLIVHAPARESRRSFLLFGDNNERAPSFNPGTTWQRFSRLAVGTTGKVWILESKRFAVVSFGPLKEKETTIRVSDRQFKKSSALGGRARGAGSGDEVWLCLPGEEVPLYHAVARTHVDARGRFKFAGVPPGHEFEVVVVHGTDVWPAHPVKSPAAGETDDSIVVDRP
ncbi:MAG: carboxypeptidase-like regulatory domain-containing protein [Planctomycetota bacterium]